jgi:hypothetical protein
MLFSPLEQFQIIPILSCYFGFVDISLTNETIILVLISIFSVILFCGLTKEKDSSYFVIPNR